MKGFEHITQIIVPKSAVDQANSALRGIGERGLEGFSLWAGGAIGNSFYVRANIIPAQTGHQSPSGVCVRVGPEELHRLNVWLYENKMSIIAQIHTHPTDAYHSDTDDTFPIATTIGCVSIVIPNFARESFSLSRCAIYRLSSKTEWLALNPSQASELIRIVEQ